MHDELMTPGPGQAVEQAGASVAKTLPFDGVHSPATGWSVVCVEQRGSLRSG